jgi:hypothetical protein
MRGKLVKDILIDGEAVELAILANADQAGPLEGADVVRNGRLAEGEFVANAGAGEIVAASDLVEDAETHGIGECLGDRDEPVWSHGVVVSVYGPKQSWPENRRGGVPGKPRRDNYD